THNTPPQPPPLSLHDALPISAAAPLASIQLAPAPLAPASLAPATRQAVVTTTTASAISLATAPTQVYVADAAAVPTAVAPTTTVDRKSTRLNSSHSQISYAVF